jgi:adenosylmethionine-8-amino-7-oxononanoate aminotransferase
MTALEFVSDKTTKTPLDNVSMAKIQKTTYENGAFVRVGGHNIMMSPPLIVTEDHVNKIVSALEAGIKSV